jgi:hypothetical protein
LRDRSKILNRILGQGSGDKSGTRVCATRATGPKGSV